ncbi:MAG: hypothetical protein A2534_02580 [Candidatus Magasanikbacteria bacterium RIFOXYD2_FULL_39_9]|uniref:Uncharacterized protein n=1 Tax=Candidatus Magasanikbacteria bacterium RIFOXYD1_FULL_40_23 TaxID=1798705 RepID=A0A1F6P8W3_9BACT|nr:MAG: hypothetical protein A2563_02860 [Candidatus Magasanikbacteria bacterium RIFOXYD1_FULL_40_23]OGH93075.1 MAG: hypothetical protein A2534_02580 [Candidatus Magasanikbacteria bacterium RIFOXYD2_FULL_39_9]
MKTTTFTIGIIIALAVGGGIGYSSGKNINNNSAQTKELQDSIAMMKEQSASIQTMATMMKTGGSMMQEMGMELKNDGAVSKGKDMEMMGEKYMKENIKASESSGTMKNMMSK